MIKFGVAGNSNSFYEEGYKHTTQAAEWCHKRGIELFEYSFGKGVKMTEKKAEEIGAAFSEFGLEMSAHAPYYINFSNPDDEKIYNSIQYVLAALQKLKEFRNGDRVVVHPATQGKATREEAVYAAQKNLEKLAVFIAESGFENYKICLETMGRGKYKNKPTGQRQFSSREELRKPTFLSSFVSLQRKQLDSCLFCSQNMNNDFSSQKT